VLNLPSGAAGGDVMNGVRLILMLTAALVLIYFVPYSLPAETNENMFEIGCDTWNRAHFAAQTDGDRVSDISTCQYACRLRYGPLPPTGFGLTDESQDATAKRQPWLTSPYSSPNLYWQCMTDCQQRFWRQFEEKTEGSGR
jgi:hypothetical protein